ncbi:MAG TPA: hypothetical protein VEH27_11230 [Methylomirabilota bacterium]|nr:hypothetical protein [Methylomirabilota bacterium]
MALFVRKKDPLEERSKSLSLELARVRSEIEAIKTGQPRVRSTARPGKALRTPIFEAPSSGQETALHAEPAPEVFNELGMKKFNLAHAFGRLQAQFRGPDTSNPKLVSYLAAGSIRGLKPLRYEKRVARNRFIALCIVLLLLLWGLLAVVFQAR